MVLNSSASSSLSTFIHALVSSMFGPQCLGACSGETLVVLLCSDTKHPNPPESSISSLFSVLTLQFNCPLYCDSQPTFRLSLLLWPAKPTGPRLFVTT